MCNAGCEPAYGGRVCNGSISLCDREGTRSILVDHPMAGKPRPKSCKDCGELFRRVDGGSNFRCKNCKGASKATFETAKTSFVRKKILVGERGHRCECCSLTHWLGDRIPLQLDHIDGNCDNNDRENLRLLCPTCHSLTDTWGGKNIGKFPSSSRAKKHQRYRMRL